MAHAPGLSLAIAEKRFAADGPPLLASFDLSVAPGSVVALLGASGIGKSSLLRLVAGIDRDFRGRIAIDGIEAALAPPPGFVFQDPRLLPWLTALDNIRAADSRLGKDAARTLLARLGLADSAKAYPRQLSGGMQRRVALARALARNAGLLLLDEPFVSLDSALLDDMYRLLDQVIDTDHPTMVFVTHLPADAARLADRVVVLAGRPARILHDLAFPLQRRARDRATLERYATRIATLAHTRPAAPA
ncbi:ABC transporter ATP-binding protein [uncultured Devosia sp.]|uniref:ABC transporter ATP-binding protein n=1 Tax=uncultured Devosia sp. TaxID=211434 RepID=UPI0035CBA6DA